jgi:hypothetical protein
MTDESQDSRNADQALEIRLGEDGRRLLADRWVPHPLDGASFSISETDLHALGALCVQPEANLRRSCARRDSNPQPSDP